MKANVGSYDVAARFIAGCLILMIGRHYVGWWALFGLVPILSAALGYCPVYALLHLRTTACDEVDAIPSPHVGPRVHEHFSQPAGHPRRHAVEWHRPPSA